MANGPVLYYKSYPLLPLWQCILDAISGLLMYDDYKEISVLLLSGNLQYFVFLIYPNFRLLWAMYCL